MSATTSSRSRLRVTPAPLTDPHPLQGPCVCSQPGLAPLRAVPSPRFEQPALPLRLPQGPLDADADEVQLDLLRRTTTSSDLPLVEPLVSTLARACIEVLAGVRPAPQLLRWMAADVYGVVLRRASLVARLQASDAARGGPTPVQKVTVRHLRMSTPRAGITEAAVVVQDGERVRAVGIRLEAIAGRWRITALEVG